MTVKYVYMTYSFLDSNVVPLLLIFWHLCPKTGTESPKYSHILKSFKSDNSSLSESLSTQIYHDFIYDFNSFSRELKTFQAICFLSTGSQILPTNIVQLSPIKKEFSPNDLLLTNTSDKTLNIQNKIHKLI